MQKFLGRLGLLAVVIILGFAGLSIYSGFYVPAGRVGEEVIVEIPRGASPAEVGHILDSAGIIPRKRPFYYYMRIRGNGASIQAGRFRMHRNAGLRRAEKCLADGPLPAGISLTVPEGLTIEQTAQILAGQCDLDSAHFDSLCRDRAFVASLGFENASTLEGYLYPESYSVPKYFGEKEVIRLMTEHFRRVYRAIPATEFKNNNSMNRVVTLASIIEEEAMVAHERRRISAVFHNRLERGVPLGADPTIRYALKKITGPLLVSELKNRSPYNTRIHAGLPPGPISSPGKGALEAAVNPIESDELFFVAKWDGSGEHAFSRTNREHNRKKMRIRRENTDKSNW
ncbi:MAG: endolytic transglycosylase MltG [Fibrobacterota bacterium]